MDLIIRDDVDIIYFIADIIKLSDEDMSLLYPEKNIDNAIDAMSKEYQQCALMVVTAVKIPLRQKHNIMILSSPHH